jgi:arabinose-5-phosphate isomerase
MTLAAWGREALECEAAALREAGARLGPAFVGACEAVLNAQGKVVTTGLGKSGHIARKIASTLSSTGTSAFFLHPTEALHGDFGMLQPQDCLIAVAYGGETVEVLEVARFARRLAIPVIAITGKADSSLAALCQFVLDGSVTREADYHNLAPTASSTVAIGLGDAIACAVSRARGFSQGDFAKLHPGGSLGRRLSLVKDHMHPLSDMARVEETADFHAILAAVTAHRVKNRTLGIVAVLGKDGRLAGAVSDGDVRRALATMDAAALKCRAADIMTKTPKSIAARALALDAVTVMNEQQITSLFVTEGDGADPAKVVGLVRLYDLLDAKIL